MKKLDILIKNITNNLSKDKASNFLDSKELKIVTSELNKERIKYNIYYPYNDCDRVILYKDSLPCIKLLKIVSKSVVSHSAILGSLYNMQIDMSLIGDIIVGEYCYIIVKESICEYLKYNFNCIDRYNIELVEEDIDILKSYEKKYEVVELLVPSLRMDIIVSKLTHISRSKINDVFLRKEVILNYEVLDGFSCLKENDVFSIRRFGKYKYMGIKGLTKSGNKIIVLNKYV